LTDTCKSMNQMFFILEVEAICFWRKRCVIWCDKLHQFVNDYDWNYSMINFDVDFGKYYWKRNEHTFTYMINYGERYTFYLYWYLICMKVCEFWQVWMSLIMRQIFMLSYSKIKGVYMTCHEYENAYFCVILLFCARSF
jgi:hypothetical protein